MFFYFNDVLVSKLIFNFNILFYINSKENIREKDLESITYSKGRHTLSVTEFNRKISDCTFPLAKLIKRKQVSTNKTTLCQNIHRKSEKNVKVSDKIISFSFLINKFYGQRYCWKVLYEKKLTDKVNELFCMFNYYNSFVC